MIRQLPSRRGISSSQKAPVWVNIACISLVLLSMSGLFTSAIPWLIASTWPVGLIFLVTLVAYLLVRNAQKAWAGAVRRQLLAVTLGLGFDSIALQALEIFQSTDENVNHASEEILPRELTSIADFDHKTALAPVVRRGEGRLY